jgi:hypothetical protein
LKLGVKKADPEDALSHSALAKRARREMPTREGDASEPGFFHGEEDVAELKSFFQEKKGMKGEVEGSAVRNALA